MPHHFFLLPVPGAASGADETPENETYVTAPQQEVQVRPYMVFRRCMKHLPNTFRNRANRYKTKSKDKNINTTFSDDLIWDVCKANTESEFKKYAKKLKEEAPLAFKYLFALKKEIFSTWKMLDLGLNSGIGHKTNNGAEQSNAAIEAARSLPILEQFDMCIEIIHNQNSKYKETIGKALKTKQGEVQEWLSPYAKKLFKKECEAAVDTSSGQSWKIRKWGNNFEICWIGHDADENRYCVMLAENVTGTFCFILLKIFESNCTSASFISFITLGFFYLVIVS